MRNEQVVMAWRAGRAASSSTGNLSTDGKNLYSYNLVIGYTQPFELDGDKVAILYRGKDNVSQTTACHVGLACRYADADTEPASMYVDDGKHQAYRNNPRRW